jgi:general secretion pathway protein B
MSIILDALKKLDREKVAKRGGTVNIASGILLQERSRRRLLSVPVMAVIFTALAAVVVTYYWTDTALSPPAESKPASTSPAPAVQATPAAPPLPPVAKQEPAAGPVPPAAEAKKPVDTPRARTPAVMETVKAPEKNANTAASTRPALKVSGIVWQEERPARRAFVNEIRVREGDMIKDVKVVEILPNQVRFSQDGRVFDVRLFE